MLKIAKRPATEAPRGCVRADLRAEVAFKLYQWPPTYAFLRACMLDAYAAAVRDLPAPVVDLGCGDGRFATALIECVSFPNWPAHWTGMRATCGALPR